MVFPLLFFESLQYANREEKKPLLSVRVLYNSSAIACAHARMTGVCFSCFFPCIIVRDMVSYKRHSIRSDLLLKHNARGMPLLHNFCISFLIVFFVICLSSFFIYVANLSLNL